MKIFFGFLFDYAILALINVGILWTLGWGFEVFPFLAILHFATSFQPINAQRRAGILFFGAFIRELSPGPQVVPVLSCRLVTATGLTEQRQFPAEPEGIDKTGSDVPAPGKVFPIRVTHSQKDASTDPLDKRLTTETTVVVRYRIQRGHFKEFYENIGSEEEAEKQMRDATESEIKIKFASKTVRETLLEQASINDILKTRLDGVVEGWGVDIVQVEIVEIGLNHDVNKSMSGVVKAEFDKRATIATAEAKKRQLILEGEGTADARKKFLTAEATGRQAFLEAEALGFEKLREVAGKDNGALVQSLKILEQGFAKGNTTFFDTNMILNAVKTVEEVIAKAKGGTS